MAQRLPRFDANLQREDAEKIERLVEEVEIAATAGATAGGDPRRLRGIPAIGRGRGGAIPGTRPGDSLFRS